MSMDIENGSTIIGYCAIHPEEISVFIDVYNKTGVYEEYITVLGCSDLETQLGTLTDILNVSFKPTPYNCPIIKELWGNGELYFNLY
jgi:hypothetical protein